ncbi:nuclear transport factor 2 family protein [Persicitalea sp.]|uniref:nuclear transport factor 2 family protein n=1 Tax=Persicitalea sp. TaxID=3100273 RepID=UPI00359332E4
MKKFFFAFTSLFVVLSTSGYAQSEKQEALQVAQALLDAIEQGDTTAFRAVFLPNAMIYTVREKDGQAVSASRSPFSDTFRPGTVITERMKDAGVEVQVHGNIAQVWAPYNLWINDAFSHCGVDVFTLIKTVTGWRIAALSYTIEKTGCGSPEFPAAKR